MTGVKVNDETILAEKVIVTAGAWANEIVNPLGIKFLVTFQKGQIVHLQMENTATENMPVVIPPNDQYILTFEHGHVVIGANHENENGFD
ncbi:FAD-binding oxidoreductase, partial [Bacillus paranthracis]|nr:FAD-binding oxidoreductase [Bacillus paranthracis]